MSGFRGPAKTFCGFGNSRKQGERRNKQEVTDEHDGRQPIAGTAVPHPTVAEVDPIFAAIEPHKTSHAALSKAPGIRSSLESELPLQKRHTFFNVWNKDYFVETHDPRWVAAEHSVRDAFDAEEDAAITLVTVRPTAKYSERVSGRFRRPYEIFSSTVIQANLDNSYLYVRLYAESKNV